MVSVVTEIEGVVIKKNEGVDLGSRGPRGVRGVTGSEVDLVVGRVKSIQEGVVEVDQFAQFERVACVRCFPLFLSTPRGGNAG